MKEEQVLAQLRDIHLPAEFGAAVATEFAGWPFAVLALVVFAIWVVRFWNRRQWRRGARADLSHILSIEDQATQWALLLQFACGLSGRSGRPVTLPPTAFMRPESISAEQRSEFIAFLRTELER